MAFPITFKYSKTFRSNLSDTDKGTIMDYIKNYVTEKKADNIFINDNKLTIRTDLIGWNWRTFANIDQGMFNLIDNKLIYECSMYRMYIILPIFCIMISISSGEPKIIILLSLILGFFNWISARLGQKRVFNDLISGLKADKMIE